jgi:FixJ family two-component response regulator
MRLIRRVFVVDDDQSARSGFARLLRTAGYDVREFRTAREFVDALSASFARPANSSTRSNLILQDVCCWTRAPLG